MSLILVAGWLPRIPKHKTPITHNPNGLAWSFILCVLPIIKLPVNSLRSAIAQFEETIRRGFLILQPSALLSQPHWHPQLSWASQHPQPAEAATWKSYTVACFVVMQVAWWETMLIAPLSDSIVALKEKEKFKGPEQNWLEKKDQVKLLRLIDKWTVRHVVWATLPLVSGMIALSPVIF